MPKHDLETRSSPRTGRASTAAPAGSSSAPTTQRPTRLIAGVYFLLAVVGGASTWYYNLVHASGPEAGSYLGNWFANAASSSAAADIIVVLLVTSVFYIREGRRLGWRLPLVLLFIPLNAVIAVAFSFPLFLGLRELSLHRATRRR